MAQSAGPGVKKALTGKRNAARSDDSGSVPRVVHPPGNQPPLLQGVHALHRNGDGSDRATIPGPTPLKRVNG
jgi:hypothetical protein